MRTDAKIGFAIGGVLLAVLTVYAIVVPKHSKKTTGTVSLVTPVPANPSTTDTSTTSNPPPIAAADSGTTPVTAVTLTKDPVTTTPPTPPSGDKIVDNTNGMTDDTHTVVPPKVDATVGRLNGDVYTPAGKERTHSHGGAITPLPDDIVVAATDRTYTIKPGQTLSKIAYEVYGNSRFWVAIQRENKGIDSNHLKVGSIIKLPDVSPVPGPIVVDDEASAPVTHTRTEAAVSDGHTYTVKSGDSLYGIAKRLLGSGRKADLLYSLNKDVIGPDKSRLKLGMILKLPEAARTALAN